MNGVEFTVAGTPKPQPRHKSRAIPATTAQGKPLRNKKGERVWTSQVYTPTTIKTPTGWESNGLPEWKDAVEKAGRATIPAPLTGPLEVEIVVYIDRPQRLNTKRADPGAVRCDRAVGDADNYAKAVLDALHGVAFANDAQVTDLISRKRYAAAGCQPGAIVRVRPLPPTTSLFAE